MVKLIAKKKIGFTNPETKEVVIADRYAYSTLPDWIKKDPMFKWAQSDGSIEIYETEKSKTKTVKNEPAAGKEK